MGIRIVATANNHLGQADETFSPGQTAVRRGWLQRGFRAAVDAALSWPADCFVQAGDLFDSVDPPNEDRAFVAECLRDLRSRGIRILAISGEHDTPHFRNAASEATPMSPYQGLGAIDLFESPVSYRPIVFERDDSAVAIGGLRWNPALAPADDPLAMVDWGASPDGVPRALVIHYSLDGDQAGRRPAIRPGSLTEAPIDLVIAGGSHRSGLHDVEGTTVVSPGATEQLSYADADVDPGFVTLEIGPAGVERVEAHLVAHQPRIQLAITTGELLESPHPTEWLIERVRAVAQPDAFVQLTLSGPIDRAHFQRLDFAAVHDVGAELSFVFALDYRGLVLTDGPAIGLASGIRLSQIAAVETAFGELLAANPAERRILEGARRLLIGTLRPTQ